MAHEIEDPLVEKAEVLLTKSDKGFETWLKGHSVQHLEQIIEKLELRKDEIQEYLSFMGVTETVGVCAKCKFETGCVACDYWHALAYVIRHHKVPQFWIKKSGKAFKKATAKKKLSTRGGRKKK